MRAAEILPAIQWSADIHPDIIRRIEDAIRDLDRRAYGNGQPVLHPLEADTRLRAFIAKHPSAAAAARALGVSRGFLYDIQCGRRPIPPAIQSAIGIKKIRTPERYEET